MTEKLFIFLCVLLCVFIGFQACQARNADAANPVYLHIDSTEFSGTIVHIHQLDGYTVVNKYIETAYRNYHRFFVVKTAYVQIFKETGRGLAEQGVEGKIVDVQNDIFNSVLEGEAIKPKSR